MDIGIGLPNVVRGVTGPRLLEWGQAAESAGFSSVATLDRVSYPSFEPMVVLAAVAGATKRIGLFTNVVLAPTRSTVLLAKEAASLDQLSAGRFRLGLGVGARRDDFEAVDQVFGDRGARFDAMLEQMRQIWRGEQVSDSTGPITPAPVRTDGVPILIGGQSDAAIERVVRHGVGWTSGGSRKPEDVARYADRVKQAWATAQRPGTPQIVALSYFSIGEEDRSRAQIMDYYGFKAEVAARIAGSTPRTADALARIIHGFEGAGVDELFFIATVVDLDQVDKLAALVLP